MIQTTLLVITMLLMSGCTLINSAMGYPTYTEPAYYPSSRSTENEELITENLETKRSEFKEKHCVGIGPKSCSKKFNEMLNAKIVLAYPNANYARVDLECKAEPDKCDTIQKFEGMLKDSNDEFDRSVRSEQRERAYAESREAERLRENERKQRTAAAIKAFGDSMQTYSNSMQQLPALPQPEKSVNCRSSPNYLGGYDTNCR